jgi:type VI protein secretion system component Hcp
MAWNDDVTVDPEELQSILSMFPQGETQMDMDLTVTIDGTNIRGENLSTWGEDTISAYGYYFKAQLNHAKAAFPGTFCVARNLDVASASLTSAFKACSGTSKKTMSVCLRVFRAGGNDIIGITPKPVIKFTLHDSYILLQAFLTNNPSGLPTEVLAFNYRSITIETAPQLASGLIGAVRTCQLSYS